MLANWKRYQRQLSDCIGLFGKGWEFHQWVPFHSPFYCSWKCSIVAFFPQILSTPYSLIWDCKQAIYLANKYEIIETLTYLGINMASLSGCKLPSSCSFSKETPTMKIYRRKTGQVHWCWRITQNLNHFSYLSDHTTYMQTSTLMKRLCVYVCILVT